MATTSIEIDQLGVVFTGRGRNNTVHALDRVTLRVARGEIVGIVGPSGCGKTTMLRVLAGLQAATSGNVRINTTNNDRPAVGMVFQHAGLFPWMTVLDNVAYGLRVRRMPKTERHATARRWLHAVELHRFEQAYPNQLSGGMQQRVGLARAFAYNAEVLLLDEPFGALDAQTRLTLQQLLLQQVEQTRQTALLVTHSIEEALTLCDRVLIMSARPGRLLHELHVPFARPRDVVALRTHPQFSSMFAEIWQVLGDEVTRARQYELDATPEGRVA